MAYLYNSPAYPLLIPSIADHIHTLFLPPPSSSSSSSSTVLSHRHAPDLALDPSAYLLEIRVVVPSVSYLRDGPGANLASVPADLRNEYVRRGGSDRRDHGALFASSSSSSSSSLRSGVGVGSSSSSSTIAHPDKSAWWMAGSVLRLVGDAVEREVVGWWYETSRLGGDIVQPNRRAALEGEPLLPDLSYGHWQSPSPSQTDSQRNGRGSNVGSRYEPDPSPAEQRAAAVYEEEIDRLHAQIQTLEAQLQ
ncbi:hypothetical protein EKO27_g3951, partial [Xylaria grammica]